MLCGIKSFGYSSHIVMMRLYIIFSSLCCIVVNASADQVPTAIDHPWQATQQDHGYTKSEKELFLDTLVANMTVEDLVLQIHLMFSGDIIGPQSHDELYGKSSCMASRVWLTYLLDFTMRFSPESPIGVMHDWYPLNASHYNSLQKLNLQNSRLKIPIMQTGECLHGVGSFKQSMFPQAIGLSASFDADLVYRVGRAIGTEARSIGIHACFSPVLDLGLDARWGRLQEAWGEDKILTSHMGVAYASGLSKNGSWHHPDAVVPIMKHFAAHGSPQAGHNAAPFMGHGNRQIIQDLLTPFKAAIQLGGVRGIMMAYNELDDIPASVHPMLYQALEEWGYDGFVMADDTGLVQLETVHRVADSPADAIKQWFNAGGMLQFYDYPLETYLEVTKDLITNGSVKLKTLQSHVRKILGVKWDLGLFRDPYIAADTDPIEIAESNRDLTLEAAQKSIVLLENRNTTLPLKPAEQGITKIALIGPFADTLNYGDYSGSWGQYPAGNAKTLREGFLDYTDDSKANIGLVSSWGANSWEYNSQYAIPSYLLSANGKKGGLLATYFADTSFIQPLVQKMETPALDWGLYPPSGLPSTNFSAVWEGDLQSPVDLDVDGWLGVAVGANTTVRLFVNDELIVAQGVDGLSKTGSTMSNIMHYSYTQANSTLPPVGSAPFIFEKGATYHIRIEYQAFNLYKKIANVVSLNHQLILFWNLVSRDGDSVDQAVKLASTSDLIVLAVGAAWNSDGESGDRATLGLPCSQDVLAQEIYKLGKPVVLVLSGGRPFALGYYEKSAAVLSTFFPGQSGGQAIADVLFGKVSPGGRMPITVPRHVGQLPVYYNYKFLAHKIDYLDVDSSPAYPFGYGLSYTTFEVSGFKASNETFTTGNTITFSAMVKNSGTTAGSHVLQVYLLSRVSSIVQPVKQLVAFKRVYLEDGQETAVIMELDADRYLTILNRWGKWELEKGLYTFALLAHGGDTAGIGMNFTMRCV
ncbi:glycoside hydrolase family 3 protein [Xylariales sp. AK1849]|nr:glycoside hydrolase family 3 protein [Xylariales sp. AK1849]